MSVGNIVLTCLFLRVRPGEALLPRRHWPEIVALLRREELALEEVEAALRRFGKWEAAVLLSQAGRLGEAEILVESGQALTLLDASYPARWVGVLGRAAPPSVWALRGREGLDSGLTFGPETVAVVGCRQISEETRQFAFDAGMAAANRGIAVVSGGAAGCDTAAETGAVSSGGQVYRLIAKGINGVCQPPPGVTVLSVCYPHEGFSTAAAMERNALIYAAASRSLVAESRFREGGTWHGATGAMRRRLTRMFHQDAQAPWAKAFKALGSCPVLAPEEVFEPAAASLPAPQERSDQGRFGSDQARFDRFDMASSSFAWGA